MSVKMKPANSVGTPNQQSPEELPNDAVAVLVWRKFTGPQPLTIVVTKDSWERNRDLVRKTNFVADTVYEFHSPQSPAGRTSVFQLTDVVGWAGNVHSSIVAAPKGLKV